MNNHISKEEKVAGVQLQYVSFRVDEEIYGIPVTRSREVLYLEKISRIPDAAVFLKGVIDLRGKIVPLIDMRTLFRLEPRNYDKDTVIIITRIKTSVVGFIADEVLDVVTLNRNDIQVISDVSARWDKGYVTGMCRVNDSILLLLNVDKLLDERELNNISAAVSS